MIELIRTNDNGVDDGWWQGRYDGKVGVFPSVVVEIVTNGLVRKLYSALCTTASISVQKLSGEGRGGLYRRVRTFVLTPPPPLHVSILHTVRM